MDMASRLVSIVSRMFAPIEGRDCGACSACCITPQINTGELQKTAHTNCTHLSACGDCEIYAQRPKVCRNWFCAWRRFGSLDESLRPDRSGLFAYLHFGKNHYLEQPCLIVSLTDRGAGTVPFGHPSLAAYGALGESLGLPVLYKFKPGAAVFLDRDGAIKPSTDWPRSNPFNWHAHSYACSEAAEEEASMVS